MPPARLLMTAVFTASARSPAPLRFAAGIDQAAAAHVAVGDLVTGQIDRVIGAEFGVHLVARSCRTGFPWY